MPTAHTLYYTEHKAVASPFPPLILIHGAGGIHFDWPPELRRLPGTRVIALDLPGHGRSAPPSHPDTLAYARNVCALLDALKIGRAVIAGHSMGGAVALQIGIHMADRAAGLILIGTGSKLPVDPTLPQRIIDDPAATIDWIIERAWYTDAPAALKDLGRQRLLETLPAVLRDDYLACQSFDVREHLNRITAPTLVLGAPDDQMVKLKFSLTLSEKIPNATLIVIERAGHMFPLEQPQSVAGSIAGWLAEKEW